jgi:hypothetical protein
MHTFKGFDHARVDAYRKDKKYSIMLGYEDL